MISTGGDLLCYNNTIVSKTNNYAFSLGYKTILWGCSMGPENLTEEKEKTLRKFSLIYARESLSYDFFNSIGLKNVVLFPDPAFVLKPEICHIPEVFNQSEVIGINLSSYTLGGYTLDTPFGYEVVNMLEQILSDTKYYILLIPHVTWDTSNSHQDDRIVAKLIKDYFNDNNRISILDIDNLNYCQIRYVISKCKFFIGSRTHAAISAYATCIPTIALSYSIKSRGIAKDLGLPDALIVDSNCITKGALLDSLSFLFSHEEEIKRQLQSIIPEYSHRPYGVMDDVRKVIQN
jgi:polysaccharide pyruvyl transferase WcaK-like protein